MSVSNGTSRVHDEDEDEDDVEDVSDSEDSECDHDLLVAEIQAASNKRRRVNVSIRSDVIVVVGNQEFAEESRSLSSWSDYFNAALQGGYKESSTRRLELPSHLSDPEEWTLVKALTLPFATAKLTKA
eukprot:Sro34_g021780.1 n/a (127) ;mRNA; f:6960-7341